ncbi:hypothetical protein K3495_g14020, partial [Podosphaera aphanis]
MEHQKHIPKLGRDNWERWFRLVKFKLISKKVFYTVEQTKDQFAWIPRIEQPDLTKASSTSSSVKKTPEDSSIEELSSSFQKFGGTINVDKAAQFDVDEATALFIISQSLNDDDDAALEEYPTAYKLWKHLKSKYSKTSESTANNYMTLIQNFKFDEVSGIDGCWEKLKELRRKLVSADISLKNMYPDSALFLVLTQTLPSEYKATKDGLRLHKDMLIEDKLRELAEVENDLKREENAHATVDKTGKYLPPHRRQSAVADAMDIDSEANLDQDEAATKFSCYLCRKGHYMRECTRLALARRLLRQYDKEKERKRTATKPQNNKYHVSKKTKRPEIKRNSKQRKGHGFKATAESDSESFTEEDVDSETSSDSDVDICHISKEIISRATPSTWAGDTAASSHMSDQKSLFRRLIPIKRRKIMVGGGSLYSYFMGSAEVVCEDGSSMLLSKVLYVPELGINLLSGRKLCEDGFKGEFDAQHMYFKPRNSNQKVITATMKNGLYLVTNIANYTPNIGSNIDLAMASIEIDPRTDAESADIKFSDKERYLLWHRRFAHAGKEKIRTLHHVSNLKQRILVPSSSQEEVCEVCAITKMKNKISKTLSPWKEKRLGLIQLDIAGPFPTSLRGNKYFMLIIDNATRRNWVICLPTKAAAVKELQNWKTKVEHETDEKIKSVRSDNAPELLKAIREWTEKSGVQLEPTTIASSHQNGVAERNIQTAEADMRAMLKDADLPLEFWDEAVEADTYMRNRLQTGPIVDGRQVSPEQAFTGKIPDIDHIRIWGSKCYSYLHPKTIPANQRHDKLVDRGRVGVFMGYSDTTNKQFKVYSPDLGYTSRSSRLMVDEKSKGGTVDLRLRNCAAGSQGTPNSLNDRERRGRPKKSTDPLENIPQKLDIVELKSQTFQDIQDQPEIKATIPNESAKDQLIRGGDQQ